MATTKPVTFPPKRLAAEITSSDLSFKLPDIVGWDGVNDITSASFGTVHYVTFRNDTNTRIEIMQIDPSTIANYATSGITINLRGLAYDGTSLTEDAARKFTWPRNETIVELGTNAPQLYGDLVSLGRAHTLTGILTFTNTAMPRASATVTYGVGSELHLVTKEYADALTFAGAPDASTSSKGIVEEATQAELLAATAAGATGARLFVNPSLFATSGVSKALLSKTDGLIDDSLLALTTAGDLVYSNGTDLTRLAIGSATKVLRVNSAGTAPEWAVIKGEFGGDGSDGALNVTSGTTTLDAAGAQVLIKNYTSVNVSAGATLTISNPHASGTILIIKSQGAVTIAGTVAMGSMGATGASSSGATGTTATAVFVSPSGGVGVGADRVGGAAGSVYAVSKIRFGAEYKAQCGSGGGASTGSADSSAGTGGRGGGALYIECGGAWNFTGTINASGANGTNGGNNSGSNSRTSGGGGGGAGGSIIAVYASLTADSGTYTLTGGNGGNGGNGSAGGAGELGSGGAGGGSNRVAGGAGGTTPSGNSQNGVSGSAGSNDDGNGGSAGTGGTAAACSAGSGGGGGAGGYKIVGAVQL